MESWDLIEEESGEGEESESDDAGEDVRGGTTGVFGIGKESHGG